MRIMLLLYHGVENGKLMALIREWASTATMTSSSEYTYPGGVILPESFTGYRTTAR
jgi:hypothetical protein